MFSRQWPGKEMYEQGKYFPLHPQNLIIEAEIYKRKQNTRFDVTGTREKRK